MGAGPGAVAPARGAGRWAGGRGGAVAGGWVVDGAAVQVRSSSRHRQPPAASSRHSACSSRAQGTCASTYI
jgi:hypothetical protein